MVIQPTFGNGHHDILQYHVFSEGKYFAARVFWTETMWHHSAWVYDGEVRELWNDETPLEQSDADHVDIACEGFSMSVPNEHGVAKVVPDSVDDRMEMRIKSRNTLKWTFPHGGPPTIHQPNLDCEVDYQGRTYRGIGYMKRYHFVDPVTHWGYRFIHATVDDQSWALWSADATFNLNKYAYFKMVGGNGDVHEANLEDSAHRNDAVYGVIDGTKYKVELEEIATWDTPLKTDDMNSLMTQRFCRSTIHRGDSREAGYAVNELCFGTLG